MQNLVEYMDRKFEGQGRYIFGSEQAQLDHLLPWGILMKVQVIFQGVIPLPG